MCQHQPQLRRINNTSQSLHLLKELQYLSTNCDDLIRQLKNIYRESTRLDQTQLAKSDDNPLINRKSGLTRFR